MKKVILTVAAIFAFGFANAQDKKDASGFGFTSGDVFIEGSVSFDSTNDKNTETKTNDFEVNPKVGYFLNDNFAVGAELSFGSGKTEVAGTETAKTSSLGIGVFGRYYFLNLGERFKTYTEFGFGLTNEKDDIADVKTTGFGVGAGLGMNYFVTPKMAISFGLSDILTYNSTKTDVTGDEGANELHLNVNVFNNFFATPTFGMLYKF
ncbi:MAG: outer membrane beta-barrel protein [Bacteroidota bacterium]